MVNISKYSNTRFIPSIKFSMAGLSYLAFICLILLTINMLYVEQHEHPCYEKMIHAARRMNAAISQVQKLRKEKGLSVDLSLDPIHSGFIGVEFSPITTTVGNLTAKQTAVNPDFAALYIHWFNQLGMKNNDRLVIHASASFPALSIAAIIAAEVYGLQPVIFSSAGASSFGANLPEFTYWDIEHSLFQDGIIHHHTQYATPGGQNDNGMSFWPGGMQIVVNAAQRIQYNLHIPQNLDSAITEKINIIEHIPDLQLFVNIGGNQAATGRSSCSLKIPVGLITSPLDCDAQSRGLIHLVSMKGIPVIHMLQIRDIAAEYGLSLDPLRDMDPGNSGIYFTYTHSRWLPAVSILFVILNLIIISRIRKK
jgi:poly-gamma-glutamate system protein